MHHQQELRILNRIVQWNGARGSISEADPRHKELIFYQLQLGDAKSVAAPGAREEGRTEKDADQKLEEKEAT